MIFMSVSRERKGGVADAGWRTQFAVRKVGLFIIPDERDGTATVSRHMFATARCGKSEWN